MFVGFVQRPFLNLGAVSRFAFVLAVAFLLSAALVDGVEAKRIPANGVSIASRVQNQKDSCAIEGGSFTSKDTAFGSTITTCSGGSSGGTYTCVNTEQSTNCTRGLTRPEEDPHTPPTGGVIDDSDDGGANHHTGGVAKSRRS